MYLRTEIHVYMQNYTSRNREHNPSAVFTRAEAVASAGNARLKSGVTMPSSAEFQKGVVSQIQVCPDKISLQRRACRGCRS